MTKNDKKMQTKQTIFIAIPIDEQLQVFNSLQKYFSQSINSYIQTVTSVSLKDLHVTVAYIGTLDNAHIKYVYQAVATATNRFALLKKKAYLIWRGSFSLYNNALALSFVYDEGLMLLVKMIRNALKDANISFDDRFPFTAHLTIARIKPSHVVKRTRIKQKIVEIIKEKTGHELKSIIVKRVGLYKSGEPIPFKIFTLLDSI